MEVPMIAEYNGWKDDRYPHCREGKEGMDASSS
jgi:hypothetical protein